MKVDAVVLAGGRVEASLRSRFEVAGKGFIPVDGRPMLLSVLTALRSSPSVERIGVSVPGGELAPELSSGVECVAQSGENLLASAESGLEALGRLDGKVLLVPCDALFLTPEAVEDFLERCGERRADLYYSYLVREDSEARYPGLRHTYVRLREGSFCGGSLVLLEPGVMEAARHLFEKVISARKKPWRLAALLGFKIIWKFSRGTLTVQDLEERVSKLLGRPAAGIRSRFAEIAFNVDKLEDLEYAEKVCGGEL